MAEEATNPCGCGCGGDNAPCPGLGHNDELDLQFMIAMLQVAHDLVADPESSWRKQYANIHQLRLYVRRFVSEQLRASEESTDPTLGAVSETVLDVSCDTCRNNYYACMSQVPCPPDCYEKYLACVSTPCT